MSLLHSDAFHVVAVCKSLALRERGPDRPRARTQDEEDLG